MQEQSFQQKIFSELKIFFSPLSIAASSQRSTQELMAIIGFDATYIDNLPISNIETAFSTFSTTVNGLDSLISTPPSNFVSFLQELNANVKNVFNAFEALNNVVTNTTSLPTSTKSEFANGSGVRLNASESLLELLVNNYIHQNNQLVYQLLVIIGVLTPFEEGTNVDFNVDNSGNTIRSPYMRMKVNYSKFTDFLSNPVPHLKSIYSIPLSGNIADYSASNGAIAVADKLFPRLVNLFELFGMYSYYGASQEVLDSLNTTDQNRVKSMLTAYLRTQDSDSEFGFTIGLNPQNDGNNGVIVYPFGVLNFSKTIGENNFLTFNLSSNGAFAIGPNGLTLLDGQQGAVKGNFNYTRISTANDPAYLIGSTSSTHLRIGEVILSGFIDADAQKQDAGIEMELRDAYLKIAGKDGDGFISNILPADGLKVGFNLTVGYSKNNGLYFGGSGGMQTSIPVNKSLGPVDFKTVDIGLGVINGKIKATVGTSFAINLGLFTAELKDIGLRSDIGFPSSGGNLGPIDLDMGFKLPKGVGIAFESELVTGGGYIEYDEEKEEYAGVVEIKFLKKITAKAVAVLSTKMADGSNGFSLLLIVSAEGFTPVPLGFGFNLIGVGGLLGLNRGYVRDELVKGLYDGGIQDVMFPQIIEKDPKTGESNVNFSRVISNVKRFFPVENERFLFGPFGKINWGGSTLISADVGIVFKIPDLAILMLGIIRVRVPDEDQAYLKVNVNFLGEINLKKKYVAFDAVIYNSQLLTFTLSGTMAFRFLWGDNPQFLMSIGGFHPAYQVPSGLFLPEQQRLTVAIADSDNLKLRLQSYFALTSNSVQFGAALYGYAEAGPCSAEGAVIFDALFMFSPFRMDIGMDIYVRIKYDGDTILSANLEMHLTGPNPWKAKGSISFTVFGFIDCSIDIDHQFGDGQTQSLPLVNIADKLIPALSKKENWKTTLDLLESQQVTMRKEEVSNLLVAPNGKLIFQQGIVPLFTQIEKFGQNQIGDYYKFDLTNVRAGNSTLTSSVVRDNFPSSEFFQLSDSAKLDSANSYTNYPNGLEIAGDKLIFTPYYNRKEIKYEETFIDGGQVTRNKYIGALPAALNNADLQYHLQESAINKNGFSVNKIPVPTSLGSLIQQQSLNVKIIDKVTGASIGSYATSTEAGSELASIVKNDPSLRGKYTISY